ncbi:MAG: hypothetical protein LW852_01650 [Sediminibacterium sp.]|nr:hypothetical protein [Sediminibacterium sp.]
MKPNLLKFCCFLLLGCSVAGSSLAQQQVALEEVRCYSAVGPLPDYLRDQGMNLSLASQLQQILYQERYWQLTDSLQLPIIFPQLNELKKEKPLVIKNRNSSLLHLWIDLFEMQPSAFFSTTGEYGPDTVIASRSSSVIKIIFYLVNSKNELVEKNELDLSLTQAESPAIGFLFNGMLADGSPYFLTTTARGFRDAILQGMKIIFDRDNTASLIELKVPPAFFYNNFIPSGAQQSPGILIKPELKNNAFRFTYNNGSQLLRNGEPEAAEVWVTNKKRGNFPGSVFDSLKLLRQLGENDFFCLQHLMRDVLNDKTYDARIFSIANQATVMEGEFPLVQKRIHYLLQNSDTVAYFSVKNKPRLDETELIWVNRSYNGIDSATVFNLEPVFRSYPLPTEIELSGVVFGQPFYIRIRGRSHFWKDIGLNHQLVMRVHGKNLPERILMTQPIPDTRTMNLLLLLAYSPVFNMF